MVIYTANAYTSSLTSIAKVMVAVTEVRISECGCDAKH
jgi:hypothetical protein